MSTELGPELWAPSPERRNASNMGRYLAWLRETRGLDVDGYAELWEWSTTELEAFWASIWDFTSVISSVGYDRVLATASMPGAQWFIGSRLNYAENVLARGAPNDVAVIHQSELRPLKALTWHELRTSVTAVASGLRQIGVGPGDRVVGYMPNIPETVVAFLAVASIGATWSSCSPDLGATTAVDRFAQIEPKVLICVDGYMYGGEPFDRRDAVAAMCQTLPTLEHVVEVPYLDDSVRTASSDKATTWSELFALGEGADPAFEQVPFDHPLWILFSSGTTGLPKAIVQSHGGILLEHLKSHILHLDLKPSDRFLWFTTTGWMMWNYLVSGLLTGAAIVLYDGHPGYPDMSRLWDLVADAEVTTFGTSASYIAGCMKAGIEPAAGRDLSALTALSSTGSPLVPEGFDWVYEQLGDQVWLVSASGGTDICAAFLGGVPLLPVHRGELQGRALGARVEAFDADGNSVVGRVGELVVTKPMPSMPTSFWGDDAEMSRYMESYFEMYPGSWRHGDWIEITERGTGIVFGRSDSTINRSGVRMGTSELYRPVLALSEVVDAVVVDIPREGTSGWMPMFVVLRPGLTLDAALIGKIKATVGENCSPRHVPNEVYQIAEVPRTLTGKILEVPIKRILMGESPDQAVSRDAMANPGSLDFFTDIAATLMRSFP